LSLALIAGCGLVSFWLWVGVRLVCWEGQLGGLDQVFCDWSWLLVLVAIVSGGVVVWRLTYDLAEIAVAGDARARSHARRAWEGYRLRQKKEERRIRRLALPVAVIALVAFTVFTFAFFATGPLNLRTP